MDIDDQALAECDAEPIHIPGVIQQNGALLSLDRFFFKVTYVSNNAQEFLGQDPKALLGSDAEDLFGKDLTHQLRNILQIPSATKQRIPVGHFNPGDQTLEIHAFVSDDQLVLELEPAADVPWSDADLSARIVEVFQQVNAQTSVENLLKASVRWLEILSGFDRVMVYRFKEDWSGEIVAERNNSIHDDFLHLCFPKWDIPTQAREIMLRLPLRMITNAGAEPVRILAADGELPPLDISLAHLRGASPLHLKYLENMGVAGTMTLSIVVQGKLWGIISFHHCEPMVPAPRFRAIAAPFIEYFNVKLTQLIQSEASAVREQARKIIEDLRKSHGEGVELADIITGDPMPLLEQFAAQGMAIRINDLWQAFGRTVPAKDIDPLIAEAQMTGQVVSTEIVDDRLISPNWEQEKLAGALVISLGGDDVAVVFREAIECQVNWAGSPEKDIKREGTSYRLSPRGSFDLYVETVKHRAMPWRPIDIELAEGLAGLFLQSEQQRQRIERIFYEDRDRQQRLMINELNHRVRNILALIRSVSRQAQRNNASIESYSAALEHRIKALAVAHDLSNDTSLTSVNLSGIIRTELAPYAEKDTERFTMSGPEKAIRPDLCPIFALVIHELSTNAAKYGALSEPDGSIDITFVENEGGLQIRWQEIGGPPAVAPLEKGFGSVLIGNAIPFELDGKVDLDFQETGLVAEIWLPDDVLSTSKGSPAPYVTQLPDRLTPGESLGEDIGTVLLVEDNYAIALDTETMLREIGFSKVVTASNVERALKLLKRTDLKIAIMDMHLGSETSFPVARELIKRNIPLVFATGYGSDIGRPPGLDELPLVTKPVEQRTLSDAIAQLLSIKPSRKSA